MKKSIIAALLFLGLAAPKAHAGGGDSTFNMGNSTGTAFVQVVTGAGSLTGIEISSGAAGDFIACWDSGSATGFDAIANGVDDDIRASGTAISAPKLMTTFVAATNTSVQASLNVRARKFTNGLVCVKKNGGASSTIGTILYQSP